MDITGQERIARGSFARSLTIVTVGLPKREARARGAVLLPAVDVVSQSVLSAAAGRTRRAAKHLAELVNTSVPVGRNIVLTTVIHKYP